MSGPTVSTVLVTWNSLSLVKDAITSVRAQTHRPSQIIAVDNGSSDGLREWLLDQPDVEVILNADNRGFAAANNQGIRSSTGELVLLLNGDVELGPNYIERCAAQFRRQEISSVTGKLLRADPPGVIDSTGHVVFGLGWAENRGETLKDSGFDQSGEVFGVCAAAAIYRRSALDSVALDGDFFDESFFSYIEDVDLDWRLRWAGWVAWYEPAAVAIHHRHGSGGRRTPTIMRHILKNRLLTVVKNYDSRWLVTNAPSLAAFTIVKTFDFGRRHPSAALALFDFARLLPSAIRKRRQVTRIRRVSAARVHPWLLRFPWRRRLLRRLRVTK